MRDSWNDFRKSFPWKAMTIGFLIPKGMLFIGISLNMLFPGAVLAVIWCLIVYVNGAISGSKVNIFMVLALVMILLRVAVILASESPSLYLIAQALDSAVYAAIFFVSLLLPRSIIQIFAEASGIVIPDAIHRSLYYNKAWKIVTAVWAAAYMLVAIILAILKMGSMKSVAIVDMLSSWPLMIVLIAFTVIFPRWYWKIKLGEAAVRDI